MPRQAYDGEFVGHNTEKDFATTCDGFLKHKGYPWERGYLAKYVWKITRNIGRVDGVGADIAAGCVLGRWEGGRYNRVNQYF